MDVYGFHIVSEPTDQNESGFSTIVTDAAGTVSGPFKTIKEAIDCAHTLHAGKDREARDHVEKAVPATPLENNEQPPTTELK